MADFPVTAQYVPLGVNHGNVFAIKVTCPAMVATDTLSVTLPDGAPKDALPLGTAAAYALSSDTYTRDADVSVGATTHNRSTGVTVFTAAGAVAAGTVLVMAYIGIG